MSSTTTVKKQGFVKRPDVGARDKKLDVLKSQLKKIDTEIASLRKQIDQQQVASGAQDQRSQLQNELRGIIKTQSDLKSRRQAIHDQVKALDAELKRKKTQIGAKVGGKSQYQSVDDIEARKRAIDADISSGELSLVEEKLLVKELQSLNKLARDLQAIEPIRKSMEDDKSRIAALKQELNELNPKEVSGKFETTQKKLNDLQSKNQTLYDKRQTLFNKRSALYKKRDEVYAQISQIRSDFDNEFKAFKHKLEKERLKREEEQKLSKLLEEKDAVVGKLQEKLTHARQPAFTYEIGAIENVLCVLDPSYVKPAKHTLEVPADSNVAKAPVRKVEADDLVPIVKEKEEFFAMGTKSKKNKKKQGSSSQSPASSGKFSLEPTMIATLAELDVTVPLNKEEVPKTIEQLRAKHEDFTARQDEQTEKNIAEAEAKLKELDLEYAKKEENVRKELEEKRAKEQEQEQEQGQTEQEEK
ncbi:Bfr1p [Lachancea thermotolerans CBS 6340]|uniref:KLTH0D09636p n=1 Tax=Lachancea thermotolerans (strain ATCC 56472 / CBS 6340 / NRRL Y-8284) TaxID=559295 RepID=C5DET6_LACTC|nr:KLTH0D09636p [Lachancea thermotolerans CBS 6340]CAR22691.1 KLTH0D09636p [Lachancea thermotolerans CBS 6340]